MLCDWLQVVSVAQALRSHVASQLGSNSPEEARAASGKEWVRGWDDSWRYVHGLAVHA